MSDYKDREKRARNERVEASVGDLEPQESDAESIRGGAGPPPGGPVPIPYPNLRES